MADILILGGTRNLGHITAMELLRAGHRVSILNRGVTLDELPANVERLHADRHDPSAMKRAVGHRSFDMVLDTTTYDEVDARQAIDLFDGRVARYVFISSGQVYLVRRNLAPPFRELDYDGAVMSREDVSPNEITQWEYGIGKRAAEDAFHEAWHARAFPVTTLRLPMVASERDHYGRIQAYLARLDDGGPIVIADGERRELRHVYVLDVATVVGDLIGHSRGVGRAYNVSFGDSMPLDEFLELLARVAGKDLNVLAIEPTLLQTNELLPHCSPFSAKWMSVLDNTLSRTELDVSYTPPDLYLPRIVADYNTRWRSERLVPPGYEHRQRELELANRMA